MARSKKKVADEDMGVDDILDEILEADAEDLEPQSIEGEEEQEPEEREQESYELADDDQDPSVEDVPSVDDQEAAGELEASDDDGSRGSESDASPPANDDEAELSDQEREKKGLLRTISELRRKIAEGSARPPQPPPQQYAPPVPPPATESTAPPPGGDLGRVASLVSEDGSQVYSDPDALDSFVTKRARELIAEASQPSPKQMAMMANQQVVEEFVAADPERNQAVAARMKEADDFVTLHVKKLVADGHQFRSIQEVTQTMHNLGLDKNVFEYFPEIEPIFDEFVQGSASGDPTSRKLLLRVLANGASGTNRGGPIPVHQNSTPKQDLEGMPRSMTRKGGSRTPQISTDESEFQFLQDEFEKDVILFPPDKWDRLTALGKQLGKDGY